MEKSVFKVRCRAFIFPWYFLWFGWILEQRDEPTPFYADNEVYYTIRPTVDVPYFTIGFSRDKVSKRIEKYYKKEFGNGRKD